MPKTQKTLNTLERAQRVLVSQGRSKLLATSTMAQYVTRLAALCDEKGKVGPGAPEKFMDIWHEHTARLDEQKATDEETEKGGLPESDKSTSPTTEQSEDDSERAKK